MIPKRVQSWWFTDKNRCVRGKHWCALFKIYALVSKLGDNDCIRPNTDIGSKYVFIWIWIGIVFWYNLINFYKYNFFLITVWTYWLNFDSLPTIEYVLFSWQRFSIQKISEIFPDRPWDFCKNFKNRFFSYKRMFFLLNCQPTIERLTKKSMPTKIIQLLNSDCISNLSWIFVIFVRTMCSGLSNGLFTYPRW